MMNPNTKNRNLGFTLIEILVVVAIIGMISAVVMVSLRTARAKGRDAKRKSDLVQLQKALELYQLNNNGYPLTGSGNSCGGNPNTQSNKWGGLNSGTSLNQSSGANGWIPNLAPTYLLQLPVDPAAGSASWSGYNYCSDGSMYKIIDYNTPESFPLAGDPFYDPIRPTWAWMVCNGQTACDTW